MRVVGKAASFKTKTFSSSFIFAFQQKFEGAHLDFRVLLANFGGAFSNLRAFFLHALSQKKK